MTRFATTSEPRAFVAGLFFVYTFQMPWAVRRRLVFLTGVILFFIVVVGFPVAYKLLTVPPTCADGIQNQDETAPDMGGVCPRVDVRVMSPVAPLWARSFRVRDGSYTAASYIQNSNDHAGAENVSYMFKLYDSENVLIAERPGTIFIMPGGITPVVEVGIDAGNRIVTHTFFEFTSRPVWKHFSDVSKTIKIQGRELTNASTVPRVEAQAINTSVTTQHNIAFAGVVFDTFGNAIAASETELERLEPDSPRSIVFTWPNPFASTVGRVDIIPVVTPKPAWH